MILLHEERIYIAKDRYYFDVLFWIVDGNVVELLA